MATASLQLIHFSCAPTPIVEESAQTLIHSEVIQKILNQTPTSPTQLTVTKEEISLGADRTLKLSDLPTTSKKAHKLLEAAEKVDPLSFTVIGEISSSETRCSPGEFKRIFFQEEQGYFGIKVLSYLTMKEIARLRPVSKFLQLNELKVKLVLLNQIKSSVYDTTRLSFKRYILPYQESLQKLTGKVYSIAKCLEPWSPEKVTRLYVSGSEIDDTQLGEIIEALPQLKIIDLYDCENITDYGLNCSERGQIIYVDLCPNITWEKKQALRNRGVTVIININP